jgi:hypothetical protein
MLERLGRRILAVFLEVSAESSKYLTIVGVSYDMSSGEAHSTNQLTKFSPNNTLWIKYLPYPAE